MRILVVEDDGELAAALVTALKDAGYVTDLAPDGEEAAYLGEEETYDAAILDLGLPKLDGLSVLRRWRATGRRLPVIILTARDRWTEKVQALNAGADDYLTKPFMMPELLARLNALIRRAAGQASSELALGPLMIDMASKQVLVQGLPVRLTALEYGLLVYLALHAGRVISKAELTEHLYDQDFDRDSNVIEVMIGRLRRKLGIEIIETLRGLGYRLTPPPLQEVEQHGNHGIV